MGEHGLVDRVVGVGILGHGVQEGASAEAGGLDALGDGRATARTAFAAGRPAAMAVVHLRPDGLVAACR